MPVLAVEWKPAVADAVQQTEKCTVLYRRILVWNAAIGPGGG
jgi:hypothetical protein